MMGDWIQSLNEATVPFLNWIQGFRSPFLDSFMLLMTWLGREYFYILFFPFLYWCVSKRWGLLAGLSLVVSLYVGEYLKWFFKLPRPTPAQVMVLSTETSPGFVSTHAAPALGVWGTLAAVIRRPWFTLLAVFLLVAISVSRFYLGVHFLLDVIGGWLVGLVAMLLSLRLLPSLGRRAAAWSLAQQVGGVLLLAAIMLAIFPSNWEGQRPAESGVLNAGVLLGFLLGLIWDQRQLHFEVGGVWWRRLLRYLLGILLVLAAFLGLDILLEPFAQGAYLTAQILRLLRYAMIGFVVTGLGPWLFQRLRLA